MLNIFTKFTNRRGTKKATPKEIVRSSSVRYVASSPMKFISTNEKIRKKENKKDTKFYVLNVKGNTILVKIIGIENMSYTNIANTLVVLKGFADMWTCTILKISGLKMRSN